MVITKLLPDQIPKFWEVIKFAVVNADEVNQKDRESYLLDLLHSLLNSRSQCFLKLDDERLIQALLITKITINKITAQKELFILPLFSWKHMSNEEWIESFGFIKKFAEREKCSSIYFESGNPRVWQLGEALGFKESIRRFKLYLGGV